MNFIYKCASKDSNCDGVRCNHARPHIYKPSCSTKCKIKKIQVYCIEHKSEFEYEVIKALVKHSDMLYKEKYE